MNGFLWFPIGVLFAALVAQWFMRKTERRLNRIFAERLALQRPENHNEMAHELVKNNGFPDVSVWTLCQIKKIMDGFNAKTRRWK